MPPTTRADPGYSRAHTDAVIEEIEPAAAVDRAVRLAAAGGRRLLGIAGAPGAGKSTLAAQLAGALGDRAAVVPMDGFHLAQAELERLGRADRKGAQDTFDPGGLVTLLGRLRAADEPVVYAPAFRREIEEPIAGAIPVPADVPLVVCEGNYLLLADGAWRGVRPLLDACWFVESDERVRLDRLVRRHVAFGKAPAYAAAWVERSDQVNARLVATTRARADLIVRVG
jgi:pantothenate kinase